MRKAVLEASFGSVEPGWDYVSIEGEDVWPRLREAAAMPPWTAPVRFVAATVPDLEPSPQKWAEALAAVPPTSRVMLLVESDRPAGLETLVKRLAAVPASMVVDCTPLKPGEAEQWAAMAAARLGRRLGSSAARLLVHRAGTNAGVLQSEVAKLAMYAGRRSTITVDDVVAVSVPSAAESVFSLMDAIGTADTSRALAVLHQVLAQGENPLGLLALLVRHVRQLWLARASAGPAALADELHVPRFVAEKLLAQARRLDYGDLAALWCRLADADEAIKTGRVPGAVALEMVVLGLEIP